MSSKRNNSPKSEALDPRDSLLFENANKLRLHQDNLRWAIVAGFTTLVGAGAALSENLPQTVEWWLPWFFLIVSSFTLIILAIENWYYNAFESYVSDCEERITRNKRLRSTDIFIRKIAQQTTPYHPSFFFVLVYVALIGAACLFVGLRNIGSVHDAISLIAALLYMVIAGLLCRFWQRVTYPVLLRKLDQMFGPSPTDFGRP